MGRSRECPQHALLSGQTHCTSELDDGTCSRPHCAVAIPQWDGRPITGIPRYVAFLFPKSVYTPVTPMRGVFFLAGSLLL